jgi:outer membrane protein assembly factor BamC
MKTKIGRFVVIAAVLANVPACSYVKSLFPDKEKDYQFTTEIPP